jgi:ABC-type multidrug transport system ATPase subunit
MYTYKLTRIIFKDGTAIEPGSLTVIIGPNNAGKSRVLKDIVAKTTQTTQNQLIPGVVVGDVEWTLPQSIQKLHETYNIERYRDEHGNWTFRTLAPELCRESLTSTGFSPGAGWLDWYEGQFQFQGTNKYQFFAEHFGRATVAFLTTEHRLQLVKESSSPAHEKEASNLLQALYHAGRTVENSIRTLVKRAFKREIILDFTLPQRLQLRVGDDFSTVPLDPRDARPILAKHDKLDDQGDGLRSFVGILVALLAMKRSLFLIDEPEAFLHPPQAFKIGEFLAQQANNTRQIILATHSVDVLRGILSEKQDVDILRIDRVGNTNYFRLLDPDRLKELVNDPLLSSARVLDGLFYSGAVVVEADSDARFYQTTSRKRRAEADFHFVNADNKQTVPRIAKMYRDMGVGCAGIVDFDVLNDSAEFKKQLEALALNEEQLGEALTIRDNIGQAANEVSPDERLEKVKQQMTELLSSLKAIQDSTTASDKKRMLQKIDRACQEIADSTKSWKQFKQQGRAALSPELQTQFDRLWDICAEKGLFINPCGELESMLAEYGIAPTTDKRGWITQALQLLPNLEVNDEKYPWKFVKAIHDQLLSKVSNE